LIAEVPALLVSPQRCVWLSVSELQRSPQFQQALANQSMNDFLILEYNDRIGGRLFQTEFGADSLGNPYTVELGANWVTAQC
jgi:hypothetical protein